MKKINCTENLKLEDFSQTNANLVKPFLLKADYAVTDNTVGCLFMWRKNAKTKVCIYKDCLILFESFDENTHAFRYPFSLSGDLQAEEQALKLIERYAQENQINLNFSKLDERTLSKLVCRYKDRICITNSRYWRDYLYNADDLKFFKGKKYSGQRNHINKFKGLYPNFEVKIFTPDDSQRLKNFLDEFGEKYPKNSSIAKEELEQTREFVDYIETLGQLCAYIEIDGKIAAMSIGEVYGDCLIVHCEKAFYEYEGIYPLMVSEFAKLFAGESVKFINREDDSGDLGLRRSKMQYKPIELMDKMFISIKRSVDELDKVPTVLTERLTLKEIEYEDKAEYNILSTDEELNKYWGYDYKEHLKGELHENYFVDSVKRDFEKRSVVTLGVYLRGRLIGEVVLQYFDYFAGAEIGARICSKFSNKGYGREALTAAAVWAMDNLNLEKIYAKCYKQNAASRNMLLKSGMREYDSDDTFYYFLREN